MESAIDVVVASDQSVTADTGNWSEKKRRYVICNQQDVTELKWKDLQLCASKNTTDYDNHLFDEGYFKFHDLFLRFLCD